MVPHASRTGWKKILVRVRVGCRLVIIAVLSLKYIHINMSLQKHEGFRTEIQLVEYDNMMIGTVIIIFAFIVSIFKKKYIN